LSEREAPALDRIKAITALRQVNLNVLPVMADLLRTKSVSQTAANLRLTQPAVSHMLRQLRDLFDDELLAAAGRENRLTERALSVQNDLNLAVAHLYQLLKAPAEFDPAIGTAQFTLRTVDYVIAKLAPVIASIVKEAPGVSISFVENTMEGGESLSEVDFLIAPQPFVHSLGKRLVSATLWRETKVCIAAADNKIVGTTLSTEDFVRSDLVTFELGPSVSPDTHALLDGNHNLHQVQRRIATPDYIPIGALVELGDMIALVPESVAQMLRRSHNLCEVATDFPLKAFDVDLCWSLAAEGRPGHRWLRERIVEFFA